MTTRLAWLAAAVAGVVVGVAAALAVASGPATYASSATLLIDQPRVLATSSNPGVVDKLSQLRKKYTALVPTQAIARPVAQAVHAPVGAVAGHLFAYPPPQSLLMVVGARADRPATAEQLAGAAVDALTAYLDHEQKQAGVPAGSRIVFDVVTPAGAAAQVAPTARRVRTVGAAAGVLAAVVTLLSTSRWRRWAASWVPRLTASRLDWVRR